MTTHTRIFAAFERFPILFGMLFVLLVLTTDFTLRKCLPDREWTNELVSLFTLAAQLLLFGFSPEKPFRKTSFRIPKTTVRVFLLIVAGILFYAMAYFVSHLHHTTYKGINPHFQLTGEHLLTVVDFTLLASLVCGGYFFERSLRKHGYLLTLIVFGLLLAGYFIAWFQMPKWVLAFYEDPLPGGEILFLIFWQFVLPTVFFQLLCYKLGIGRLAWACMLGHMVAFWLLIESSESKLHAFRLLMLPYDADFKPVDSVFNTLSVIAMALLIFLAALIPQRTQPEDDTRETTDLIDDVPS